MMSALRIVILRNAMDQAYRPGNGKSGGDSIFQECAVVWSKSEDFSRVDLVSCTSGLRLSKEQMLPNQVHFHEIKTPAWLYAFLPFLFIYKTLRATLTLWRMKLPEGTWLFSSSDIFPDVLPLYILKIFRPRLKWLAAFYFFAPTPFSKNFSYRGFVGVMRGLLYYLSQLVCYRLILQKADRVLLCNEVDRVVFSNSGYSNDRMLAIYGGVRLAEAKRVPEPPTKDLTAIFMARFHSQKGALLAVKIWSQLIKIFPQAKLGMIGMGPQEAEIKELIKTANLEKNIELFGFQDGEKKYALLKRAQFFFHPAVYETGGMAAAEGMAAGLPVLAYEHEGFKYCYPQGMLTVKPIGHEAAMTEAVISFLKDVNTQEKLKLDARMLVEKWDWASRAKSIHELLKRDA